MEWVVLSPSAISEVCNLLGTRDKFESYVIKEETFEEALDKLTCKVSNDDLSLHARRTLGLTKVLQKDLIPFLLKSSNDKNMVALCKVIKLLSHLTSPLECIIPHVLSSSDDGDNAIKEAEAVLKNVKMEFTDFKTTKAVVDYLKELVNKGDALTTEQCEGISEGLLLVRNILHISIKDNGPQNQILWNLFAQSMDKILLYLMTCKFRGLWSITLVQIIALVYKDQHVSNLQKLLNLWIENSMSESSEDNESNTSPADQDPSSSHSFSPNLTSDPTSDSSDNNGAIKHTVSSASTILGASAAAACITTISKISSDGKSSVIANFSKKKVAKTLSSLFQDKSAANKENSTSSSEYNENGKTPALTTNNSINCHGKSYTKGKSKNKGKVSSNSKERQSDADSGVCSLVSVPGTTAAPSKPQNNNHPSQSSNSDVLVAKDPSPSDSASVQTPSSGFSSENGKDAQNTTTGALTDLSNIKELENIDGEESTCRRNAQGSIECSGFQSGAKSQQESNSTSSNEDEKLIPFKQRDKTGKYSYSKGGCCIQSALISAPTDEREKKRKKLHKRSKRNKSAIKGMVHHNPTEDDISHVLREFTVDFLLKGYSSLVTVLQEQLSHNATMQMDKSHFLWLITYFLKFASQLELDLHHLNFVLSIDMLNYLTFEGMVMCENLSLCDEDLKPHLRRMHLVVTAIREFIQAVDVYTNSTFPSNEDHKTIRKLHHSLINTQEIRNLFLLLIRHFKPGLQSRQYLQDLVVANHLLLLLLENISQTQNSDSFKIFDFIKEFSSSSIMQKYGYVLEDYKKNGEFVNDCVFTMMHHIAGDLMCPEALFQPLILRTFANIWEVEFEIRDEWADLIEYVIQKFMKASSEEKMQIFESGNSNMSEEAGWTKDDIENLYWLHNCYSNSSDPLAQISEAYRERASGKTRESILNQLLHQRIIGYNQFLKLLASERVENATCDGSSSTAATGSGSSSPKSHRSDREKFIENTISFQQSKSPMSSILQQLYSNKENLDIASDPGDEELNDEPTDDLKQRSAAGNVDVGLADLVNRIGNDGQDLSWLQKQVLEACHVKHVLTTRLKSRLETSKDDDKEEAETILSEFCMEPIPYHYTLLGQSIPIVPWTQWQEILLSSPTYLMLLDKLGFHLPADVGKIFPRIPHFWTCDVMLSVARKLGPLPPTEHLKFDPSQISDKMDCQDNSFVGQPFGHREVVPALRQLPSRAASNLVCIGGAFIPSNVSFGLSSSSHAINWMNVAQRSKKLIERYNSDFINDSASDLSTQSLDHADDCASLKALPPTDHSEDVTMLSGGYSDQDDDDSDEEDNE